MFTTYLKKLAQICATGDFSEHSCRAPFEELLNAFAAQQIKRPVTILHEPARESFGAPDFKIMTADGAVIGYIECKKLDQHLEQTAESEQIKKYLDVTDNLILTNYLEFWLFKNGAVAASCAISRKHELSGKPRCQQQAELTDMLTAFFLATPEPIADTRRLAVELARRTRLLKELILEELQQDESNPFRKFYAIFEKTVFHKLDLNTFADMYAEIIGFGLFFLRMSRTNLTPGPSPNLGEGGKPLPLLPSPNLGEEGKPLPLLPSPNLGEGPGVRSQANLLTKENILSRIPAYIPLLRDFFPNTKFDEWNPHVLWMLDEIIALLNNMDAGLIKASLSYKDLPILAKRQANLADPFLYFYEEFLTVYDKQRKIERGVFYTPEAVVSFIIRSIDALLIEKLGVSKGALDASLKMLDFAAGTGTFMLAMIEQIRNRLWETGNMGLFNISVNEFVLKNIFGFEYLIVPYILCHLRIHEFLESFGFHYKDAQKDRARVYLTNTLDDTTTKPTEFFEEIDAEGHAADRVKHQEQILVIMGNPPYSVSSSNKTPFIETLMKTYKEAVKGEKNIQPLSDDYIKFLRFAHWKMEQVSKGIVGVITNNSFLDGLIHRGMREELMKTFDEIYILNLHGNANKRETCPDGSKDENVFDIRQGVAIALLVKTGKPANRARGVYCANLQGLREQKYDALYANTVNSIRWEKIEAAAPDFWFVKKDFSFGTAYKNGLGLNEIFQLFGSGVKFRKDSLLVHLTKAAVIEMLHDMKKISDDDILKKYDFEETPDWTLQQKRQYFLEWQEEQIVKLMYRPFDERYAFYPLDKIHQIIVRGDSRKNFMRNFLTAPNLGLIAVRQYVENTPFNHAFITDMIADIRITTSNRGSAFIFPLYLYPEEKANQTKMAVAAERRPNFTPEFEKFLAARYPFAPAPEEVLGYIYAILYAPTYRAKYHEFLKIDFPRVPFTPDAALFKQFAAKGAALIDLHLLKVEFPASIVNFPVAQPNLTVEAVKYDNGTLWINATTYFANVPRNVWEYEIGGYQVLDKWLKERKKHRYALTMADVRHVMAVCDALAATMRLQAEIDDLARAWL